jgi:CBS domain containing-hemolysin-like protein
LKSQRKIASAGVSLQLSTLSSVSEGLTNSISAGTAQAAKLINSAVDTTGLTSISLDDVPSQTSSILLWSILTLVSIALVSTETAITKLTPWKINEIAEEEDNPNSPFNTLSVDASSIRIAVLLFTTAASIYKIPLIANTGRVLFPGYPLVFTVLLTIFQLFFEELVPTSVGVSNPVRVSKFFLPVVSRISRSIRPLTDAINTLNNKVVSYVGLNNTEDDSVSSDELRFLTEKAEGSAGIHRESSAMIKAVLDMQENTVDKIMQPRVEIEALPLYSTASSVLTTAARTKYSRIPIYNEDIDDIVGVVVCKKLFDYISLDAEGTAIATSSSTATSSSKRTKKTTKAGKSSTKAPKSSIPNAIHDLPTQTHSAYTSADFRPQMIAEWTGMTARSFMEEPLRIPQSMKCLTALQLMK